MSDPEEDPEFDPRDPYQAQDDPIFANAPTFEFQYPGPMISLTDLQEVFRR